MRCHATVLLLLCCQKTYTWYIARETLVVNRINKIDSIIFPVYF